MKRFRKQQQWSGAGACDSTGDAQGTLMASTLLKHTKEAQEAPPACSLHLLRHIQKHPCWPCSRWYSEKCFFCYPGVALCTCFSLLPQQGAKQDGAWPHKLHISYITLPKKVSASPSASRQQKHFRSHPRTALVFLRDKQTLWPPLINRLTSVLVWPVGPSLGESTSQEGLCSCAGALQLHGKFLNNLGLAGCGGEHQVSLWELLVVVGYRFGAGYIWRVALSSI